MKKAFLFLFASVSIGVSAQQVANCSMMCVLDISMDTVNNQMAVTLFNGDSVGINYPTIQVVDMNGDTVGNPQGFYNLFYQGQGTITHYIPTTISSIPQGFTCTVLVTDQIWDTTCVFSYPMSCPMNVAGHEVSATFETYPNPASDVLTLSLPGNYTGKTKVGISNMLGEVFSGILTAQNGKIELAVNDLAAGVYFVSVTIDDRSYMQLFVRK